MTNAEHDRPRPARRRQQAIAGVVGLAAVLGGGAFLIADRTSGDTEVVPTGVAAPPVDSPAGEPVPPPAAGTASAATSAGAPAPAEPSATRPAPAPATSRARSRAEMIEQAKGTAAKADNVRRPNPPKVVAADVKVTTTQTGSMAAGGTLRVVSARADLTGQRELSIVADGGRAVGAARCTQNFRFSDGAPAAEKPTLMICWRTSAGRSVYTVAAVRAGRPSAERSVAALDRRWAKLG